MPRIYTIDNEPLDYCRLCWPAAMRGAQIDDDTNAEHPDYGESPYLCETCLRTLDERDN